MPCKEEALAEVPGVGLAFLLRLAFLAALPVGRVALAGVAATAGLSAEFPLGIAAFPVGIAALCVPPDVHAARTIKPMASGPNLGRSDFREERLGIRPTYLSEADQLSRRRKLTFGTWMIALCVTPQN